MVDVNTEYIEAAIIELNNLIGIKKFDKEFEISRLIDKGKINEAVIQIARELNLPIDIELLYEDQANKNPEYSFISKSLVQYDKYGSEGIYAQVYIPPDLPFYGSPKLENYKVRILANRKILKYKISFLMVIAHELSHILLTSLNFPKKENEIYVDLVQILMGFGGVYSRGRITEEPIEGGVRKTTIGYLTEENLDFACSYVRSIYRKNELILKKYSLSVESLSILDRSNCKKLFFLQGFVNKIDSKKYQIKKEHLDDLLRMHDLNFFINFNSRYKNLNYKYREIKKSTSIKLLNNYNKKIINDNFQNIQLLKDDYSKLENDVNRNIEILLKYFSLFTKIKYRFRLYFTK